LDPASQLETAAFKGSYSSDFVGAGTLKLIFEDGFSVTFATVTTDGGQTLEFISPATGVANVQFRGPGGPGQSLTGALPAALIVEGAAGSIDISVQRSAAGGEWAQYFGRAGGSGTAACPDGSTGDWAIAVENLQIATINTGNNGQALAGNYLLMASSKACGDRGLKTLSGLVTGSVTPTGLVLMLRSNGSIISGTAKAIKGRSLKGAYGFKVNFSPYPFGQLGVMKFDGEGNVSVSVVGSGNGEFSTAGLTGTYSIDPDGSGKINFNTQTGQPGGPTYAIVVTDDGSGFMYLRTGVNPQYSVVFGTARLQ
jgi:hypothetical protein